jgi:GNAT superfamily N-acetyltransferase
VLAAQAYREASLPMIFRLHRFTQPAGLDAQLAALGYRFVDRTLVMIRSSSQADKNRPLPSGHRWESLDGNDFAQAVGALRGSPQAHIDSHAWRLAQSPVRYRGYAIRDQADGTVLCCGQVAQEAELVGLYDIFTHPRVRGSGLAGLLCERLLAISATQGARIAYLQVDEANAAARRVYARLGFGEAYSYHYREPPEAD